MLIHQIKHKNKKTKRIGRGGKKGTYSGKGIKGQKSRAGRKIRPAMRDLVISLPKKRGFRFKSIKQKPVIVNLNIINEKFDNGEEVNIAALKERKIIRVPKSKKNLKIKILGKGELSKKLIFSPTLLISDKIKEKIKATGSTIAE